MSYEPSGELTTDERQVGTQESWDTQQEWEARQSINNLYIENGSVRLARAIPDYEDLHAHYDAQELSLNDGDPVSTWSDGTGNGHDLTAGTAPTYQTSVLNGNPVVRFDGVDDFLDVAFSSLAQPNHIFAVGGFRSIDSENQYLWASESSPGRNDLLSTNDNTPVLNQYGGTSLLDGDVDANMHIFSALYNGGSSALRVDGSQAVSGNAGTEGLNGFKLGDWYDGGLYGPVDVGEVLIYPQDKSAIQSDVESYLSDKWGITV